MLSRQQYGPPCDMWALGVVAYCLLAGKVPFASEAQTLCSQPGYGEVRHTSSCPYGY